jgi:hypothetical protein
VLALQAPVLEAAGDRVSIYTQSEQLPPCEARSLPLGYGSDSLLRRRRRTEAYPPPAKQLDRARLKSLDFRGF